MKTLALIPARGESKGVPGKNIKPLKGKPLIHYTIEAARELLADADICVSTDSADIIKVVEQSGLKVPFVRPPELASDTASSYGLIDHALLHYSGLSRTYDTLIYLQPTSPFRTGQHIREALSLFNETNDVDMIVSVKETRSNPYYVLFEEDADGLLKPSKNGNFTRRQDCPKVYEYNGAIYVVSIKSYMQQKTFSFARARKYVMDEESSLDIDTPMDWMMAELLADRRVSLNR